MDITKKTVDELKALAYDLLVQSNNIQRNLQVVEKEISSRHPDVLPANEVQEEIK